MYKWTTQFKPMFTRVNCIYQHPRLVECPSWHGSKEFTCQCRGGKRHRFDPWVRKIPREGNGNPFQYSCLENPMNRGAWCAIVHGVTKSQRWLSTYVPHIHTGWLNPRMQNWGWGACSKVILWSSTISGLTDRKWDRI